MNTSSTWSLSPSLLQCGLGKNEESLLNFWGREEDDFDRSDVEEKEEEEEEEEGDEEPEEGEGKTGITL